MADDVTPPPPKASAETAAQDASGEPRRKDAPRKLARRDAGSLAVPVVAIAAGAVFASGVLLVALADGDACSMRGKPTFLQQVRRDVGELLRPTPRLAGATAPIRENPAPPKPLSPELQPNVAGGDRAPHPMPSLVPPPAPHPHQATK